MIKTAAVNISRKYNFIPGPVSRKILNTIINGCSYDDLLFNEHITKEEFNAIENTYKKYIKKTGGSPRYLVFYEMIKEKYPSFTWDITKSNVVFDAPRTENLRPSLLTLLLNRVNINDDTSLKRKYQELYEWPTPVVEKIQTFFSDAGVISPEKHEMSLFLKWLSAAINKQPSTLFIPICPDYATEPTGNPACPFRHTFTSVGSRLGPVAIRILETLNIIKNFLAAINIQPKIIAGIADFEAFSEETQTRVNLTETEFLSNVEKSRALFEEKSGLPTIMITELMHGKNNWLSKLNEIKKRVNVADFGFSRIQKSTLLSAAKKRKNLYDRWYGCQDIPEKNIPIVLNQGAEYALMGMCFHENYDNCLVLGADSDVFIRFYSFAAKMPTLYLKNNYC